MCTLCTFHAVSFNDRNSHLNSIVMQLYDFCTDRTYIFLQITYYNVFNTVIQMVGNCNLERVIRVMSMQIVSVRNSMLASFTTKWQNTQFPPSNASYNIINFLGCKKIFW